MRPKFKPQYQREREREGECTFILLKCKLELPVTISLSTHRSNFAIEENETNKWQCPENKQR
jgi:hypothetical protein